MLSGSPPPSRPSGATVERKNAARGALRDALGGIHNLEQLLKSIRVGPRALMSVLAPVHESCVVLRSSFGELLRALTPQVPEAALALERFVATPIDELEAALQTARRTNMTAKARLTLEEVVARVVRLLDSARGLVELLESAASGLQAQVPLPELVEEACSAAECRDRFRRQRISVALSTEHVGEIVTHPRVAMCLIAIAVRLVATESTPGARLHIGRGDDGAGLLSVTREAVTDPEALTMNVPQCMPPLLACAESAARLVEATFAVHPSGVVDITWPAARG